MPEWIIAAIIVVVLAGCVLLAVWIRKRRRHPRTQMSIPIEEPPSQPEIPLERQPVAPVDQAEGFGWMKASDLANQKNKP